MIRRRGNIGSNLIWDFHASLQRSCDLLQLICSPLAATWWHRPQNCSTSRVNPAKTRCERNIRPPLVFILSPSFWAFLRQSLAIQLFKESPHNEEARSSWAKVHHSFNIHWSLLGGKTEKMGMLQSTDVGQLSQSWTLQVKGRQFTRNRRFQTVFCHLLWVDHQAPAGSAFGGIPSSMGVALREPMISIRKRSNLARLEFIWAGRDSVFHILSYEFMLFTFCHKFHTHTHTRATCGLYLLCGRVWVSKAWPLGFRQATCGKYATSMTVNGKPVNSGVAEHWWRSCKILFVLIPLSRKIMVTYTVQLHL